MISKDKTLNDRIDHLINQKAEEEITRLANEMGEINAQNEINRALFGYQAEIRLPAKRDR